QHLAALGAPPVEDLELAAHEPAPATVRPRAHELGLANAQGRAAVVPALGDEEHGGDDGSRGLILHDQAIPRLEARVASAEEVARPDGDRLPRDGGVLAAELVGIERSQGVNVAGGGAAEDQPVPEVLEHDATEEHGGGAEGNAGGETSPWAG